MEVDLGRLYWPWVGDLAAASRTSVRFWSQSRDREPCRRTGQKEGREDKQRPETAELPRAFGPAEPRLRDHRYYNDAGKNSGGGAKQSAER